MLKGMRQKNLMNRNQSNLIIICRLAFSSILASFAGSLAAVARIESDVAMLSSPRQITNALVRVDQVQTFSVGARIGLAVVDVDVAVGAGVAVDTDAMVGGLVTSTISAVLTRI